MWRLRDGTMYESQTAAWRKAEANYGDALTKLARDMGNLKYIARAEFIDNNLDKFIELKELREDCKDEPEDE